MTREKPAPKAPKKSKGKPKSRPAKPFAPAFHPRATFEVDTSDTVAIAHVSLSTTERTMSPDQPVMIQAVTRFPEASPYRYPALVVRASELEDLIAALRVAVDAGRRSFVIPEPEKDYNRTFRRCIKQRAAAGLST